jgi:uncharacterized protein
MVLANEDGTVFDVLRKLTARGLGGAMGNGGQRISWIHMEDFLRAVDFVATMRLSMAPSTCHRAGVSDQPRVDENLPGAVGMPIGLPASRGCWKSVPVLMGTETELVSKAAGRSPCGCVTRDSAGVGPTVDAVADLQSRRNLQGFFRAPAGRSVGARVWLPAATR